MCGIVGYTGPRAAGPILMEGLRRLEYRGYDSAGIALVTEAGELFVEKRAGKLANLATALEDRTPNAGIGLAHTRWATHGRPNDLNAHPHVDCTARSRSSTTGSSRTSASCATAWRRAATCWPPRPTRKPSPTSSRRPITGDLAAAVRDGPGPRPRRLRHRGHAPSRAGPARRGPDERAPRGRARRRRDVPRLGRGRDPRPHDPRRLPRGGRRRRPPALGDRRSPTSRAGRASGT